MSSYAFTNTQSMLYGTYIFLANTEKTDIFTMFSIEKRTVSHYNRL